jgi:hypothetical protein
VKYGILLVAALLALTPHGIAAVQTQLFLGAGGGVTAAVDVDELGNVTCTGTCSGLTSKYDLLSGHGMLEVTGKIGDFTVDATGMGGLDALLPTRQNLNQINVSASSAGTLVSVFTDTDYTNLGSSFILGVSHVTSVQIMPSTIDFQVFGSAANSIPANTLIGEFLGLTGISSATAGTFANPIGPSGSLSSKTVMNFSDAGAIQANLTVASNTPAPVPEPAAFLLLGTVFLLTGFRFRKKLAQ